MEMGKKLYIHILDYLTWLAFTYRAIAQVNSKSFPLKLVSVDKDKTSDELYFIVQVTGKNIFPKLSINDIQEIQILSNFSADDRKTIQRYCSIPNKYISAVTFDRINKQFTYDLKDCNIDNDLVTRLTSNQLRNLLDTSSTIIEGDARYAHHLESCYH